MRLGIVPKALKRRTISWLKVNHSDGLTKTTLFFTGRVNISSPKRVAEEQAKYDKLMKRKYANLILTELSFANEEDLV